MKNFLKTETRGQGQFNRQFKTITVDATSDSMPQEKILSAITNQTVENCVVKLSYSITPSQLSEVDEKQLKKYLKKADFVRITRVIVPEEEITYTGIDSTLYKSPQVALNRFLDHKAHPEKAEIMDKCKQLMEELFS